MSEPVREPQRVTTEWVAEEIARHLTQAILWPEEQGVAGPFQDTVYLFVGGEILMVQVNRAEIVIR